MDSLVFFAVLAAAAMHAGWNAVVKAGADRLTTMTIVSLSSGTLSALFLPFVVWPAGPVWYWLGASTLLHTGYKIFLLRAYAAGDLVQVYPLARGTAPLIVAVVSVIFLSDGVTLSLFTGIAILVAGIWLMALRGGAGVRRLNRSAVLAAFGTSCFIASYTLVDGIGAREAASALSFAVYLFVLDGLLMGVFYVQQRGFTRIRVPPRTWASGGIGGALSLGAYWIVIWAMTQAPIAAVAALRETSVLFAVAIATVVMKEKLTAWRIAAALLITGGVGVLRQ